MLKLNNFHIDESKVVQINGNTVIVPFVPAIVDILALNELTSENVDKMFNYLFAGKLPGGAIKNISPALKIKIIKKIFKKTLNSKAVEKDEEYETTVNLSAMIQFITKKTNLPKNELLTRFTLSELIQLTSNLKGKDDLPFFKHQKIAKSLSDIQSLLK